MGAVGAGGYGVIHYNGHNTTAHRAVYQFLYGELTKDLVVDHLCKVPPCVNPDHLEAVSQSENIFRGDNGDVQRRRHASQTLCKNMHTLDGDNVFRDKRGWRRCRTCSREWMRRKRKDRKVSK